MQFCIAAAFTQAGVHDTKLCRSLKSSLETAQGTFLVHTVLLLLPNGMYCLISVLRNYILTPVSTASQILKIVIVSADRQHAHQSVGVQCQAGTAVWPRYCAAT